MDQLDEELRVLRDVQSRFAGLLAKTKANIEGPNREELTHVTQQLLKSLDAEIAAIERAQGLSG